VSAPVLPSGSVAVTVIIFFPPDKTREVLIIVVETVSAGYVVVIPEATLNTLIVADTITIG